MLLSIVAAEERKCSMFGICSNSDELFCKSSVSPIKVKIIMMFQIDTEMKVNMKKLCGTDYDGYACCDREQFDYLAEKLDDASLILGFCPACLKNFRKIFCELTCSPDQGSFVKVLKTEPAEGELESATAVDYYVSHEMASGFYDSCKDVTQGMSNAPIWALFFENMKITNYSELLDALGRTPEEGGLSSYKISFPSPSLVAKPANASMFPCNDPEYGCACTDCSLVCAPPVKFPSSEVCHVGHLECFVFTLILGYSIILLLSIGLALIAKKKYSKKSSIQIDEANEDSPLLSKDKDEPEIKSYIVNSILQKSFYRWGFTLSKHALLVVCISVVFMILSALPIFIYGVEIETDPINLWVKSDSVALKEKAEFDNHFDPFYRVTQVILSNQNDSSIVNRENIKKIYSIVNAIESMKVEYGNSTVELKDICVEIFPGHCMIQTITDVWKDEEEFDKSSDWLKDYMKCTKNPISCMVDNKAPLMPQVCLGGLDVKLDPVPFQDAKSFVLTFLIRNSLNSIHIEKCKAFENAVIAYLKQKGKEWDEEGLKMSFSTEVFSFLLQDFCRE